MALKSLNRKYYTESCIMMDGFSTAEHVNELPARADFCDCPFCR
jgi:hypothetical protein